MKCSMIPPISTTNGRSPHGERGLKSVEQAQFSKDTGRSPHGERGLKYQLPHPGRAEKGSLPPRGAWIEISYFSSVVCGFLSLPPRGAWIEILLIAFMVSSSPRRSPHGERGLKYRGSQIWDCKNRSLPPRGAWIEIAWAPKSTHYIPSRSPHGERGLKYLLNIIKV